MFSIEGTENGLTEFALCFSPVGAQSLPAPGDRAVSWPCRWHTAPDDDSLLHGVESVIAVLTMHNAGFTVGTKQGKWNYTSLKSLSRKGKFFNAGRMALLASLKTFKCFQKCIFSLPIHQHKK